MRRLRVLLDATAVPVDRGGVGRYVDETAAALAVLDLELVIACQRRDLSALRSRVPGVRLVAAPRAIGRRPVRLLWEQTGLPWLARRIDSDVIHSPHYTLPLLTSRPVVCTLHDATFFSDAGLHLGLKGRFFRTWTRISLRRATRCLVPSRATAAALQTLAGARPGSLTLCHLGVDRTVFAPPPPEAVSGFAQEHDLPHGWVAFLGTIEPRKNVPALIRGWVAACAGRPDPPALLLVGGKGWDTTVEAAAAEVPAGLRLVRAGYLPLHQLPVALGGAAVVAYPSLGEGFGIPVLEAMACGAAVLTTDRLALGEVGGDAVAYTETDPASIGRDLASLLDDPQRRADLGRRGLARSAEFGWDRVAQTHLRVYREAGAARRSGRDEPGVFPGQEPG